MSRDERGDLRMGIQPLLPAQVQQVDTFRLTSFCAAILVAVMVVESAFFLHPLCLEVAVIMAAPEARQVQVLETVVNQ